ncbi:hypothetical protein MCEGEM3_02638 [Oxalobacteraceae bacterium]|jgi:hypothetical protein
MTKPKNLSPENAAWADDVLNQVRKQLQERSDGDALLLHHLRRRIVKNLGYDEKSTPNERKKLKQRKMAEQNGMCLICETPLPERGYHAVLDRAVAHLGYTDSNVRLIHRDCDIKVQEERGFA